MVWPQQPIGRTRLPTERVSRDLIKLILGRRFTIPPPSVSSVSSFSTFSFVLFFRRSHICGRDPSRFVLFFRNGAKRGGLGTQCAADWSARLSVAYDCPAGARLLRWRFERTNVKERVSKGRKKQNRVREKKERYRGGGKSERIGTKCGIEGGSYFLRFYPSKAGDSFERFESMFGEERKRCRYQSRGWIHRRESGLLD